MNKSLLSLAVVSALSLGFTGCGSSSDDTPASSGDTDTSTDVEVERGKVYDATVTDSSNPTLTATMTVGSNVYTFASTPTYPITASGGWIDVDGDGNMTTEDIVNDLNLTSYSKVITPTTSYLGDITTPAGKARLDALIADMNVTEAELLKVPSKANPNAILVANAIYQKVKESNSTNISAMTFSDLNTTFNGLKSLLVTHSDKTGAELAKAIENQVVNTNLTGYITKLDASKMSEIEDKRQTATTPTPGDDTTGSSDDTIDIYLNTNLGMYNTMKNAASSKSWKSVDINSSVRCENLGFDNSPTVTTPDDITTRTYSKNTGEQCIEHHYADTYASGDYQLLITNDLDYTLPTGNTNDTPVISNDINNKHISLYLDTSMPSYLDDGTDTDKRSCIELGYPTLLGDQEFGLENKVTSKLYYNSTNNTTCSEVVQKESSPYKGSNTFYSVESSTAGSLYFDVIDTNNSISVNADEMEKSISTISNISDSLKAEMISVGYSTTTDTCNSLGYTVEVSAGLSTSNYDSSRFKITDSYDSKKCNDEDYTKSNDYNGTNNLKANIIDYTWYVTE